jgi:PAS domain S-box-containing protein
MTEALLDCLTPSEVADAVVDRGMAVLGARAGLVALATADDTFLEVVRAAGFPDVVLAGWERFAIADPLPLSDAVRENKILLLEGPEQWRARYPEMVRQVTAGHFQASAAVPLAARGRVFGGLHFSFPTERTFSEADADFLKDLGQQCALALDRALLLEAAETERVKAERARKWLEFMTKATAALGETLDYRTRLTALAALCVPDLADWAAVDVLAEDGTLHRLAVTHRRPEMEPVMRELQSRFPPQAGRHPALMALKTGKTQQIGEISDEMLASADLDPENLRLLRLVGIRATLTVALSARGSAIGAITYGMSPAPQGSGRLFTPETIAIAEELARRAAVALDNSRLFETARRESAQREQEAKRLAFALEASQMGTWELDAKTGRLYLSPQTEALFGRSSDRPVQTFDELLLLVHPADRDAFRAAVDAALASEAEYELECRATWEDGVTVRWLAVKGTILRDANGMILGAVGVVRDISQAKEAEFALRHSLDALSDSEARFRALADNMAQLAWMADPTGSIFWYNQRWFDYTGTTLDDMAGWGWQKIHHPDFVEAVTEKFREHVARGHFWEDTFPLRGKDGEFGWFLSRAFPIRDGRGKIVLWCGTNTDVSERIEFEAKQRRFLREMLFGFTDGRLRLCDTSADLPPRQQALAESVPLTPANLRSLRKRVDAVAATLAFPMERMQDLETAVGEAGMNAVRHGGGGIGSIRGNPDVGLMQIWVEDHGTGIALDQIHRAIEQGWTTGGFGQGFFLMRSCADRVYLLTGPTGTTVVLEMERNAPEPAWLK